MSSWGGSFVPGAAVALDEGGRVGGTVGACRIAARAAFGLLPADQDRLDPGPGRFDFVAAHEQASGCPRTTSISSRS